MMRASCRSEWRTPPASVLPTLTSSRGKRRKANRRLPCGSSKLELSTRRQAQRLSRDLHRNVPAREQPSPDILEPRRRASGRSAEDPKTVCDPGGGLKPNGLVASGIPFMAWLQPRHPGGRKGQTAAAVSRPDQRGPTTENHQSGNDACRAESLLGGPSQPLLGDLAAFGKAVPRSRRYLRLNQVHGGGSGEERPARRAATQDRHHRNRGLREGRAVCQQNGAGPPALHY